MAHASAVRSPVDSLIEREFDALSPELQRAARWVRSNGTVLAVRSMRSAAGQAGVSPATMTRLARRLGFDSFDALREPYVRRVADAAAVPALPFVRRARALQRAGADPLAQLAALQATNVAAVQRRNPAAAVTQAAERMLRARRVHFLGLRVCHGIAFQLAYTYGLLCGNGTLLTDLGGTLADQVAQVGPRDVLLAISQSPYTRATVESVRLARAQGAAVIALTDSALSPIARDADLALLYETASNSFFHSTTGALALVECVLAAVSARGGAAVLDRLRERQQQLRASRAYWEAPRPPS
ncbi:MAG: MurR/RpiR family transcriptional regulator [Ideonella sp.]|nr:MurR/RpiR family transcriptional regulator [Ideonella sp.]MCC7458219.1 MurR/RpiR family transcriptional regulator [Nitrospira sp.]